jgi:predicted RNA-binding protein with PUA-like domain
MVLLWKNTETALIPTFRDPRSGIRISCLASTQAGAMVCAVMSQFWLVKQEPTAYSWDQFVADGKTNWTGVRNFQARNNLRNMKLDDEVLFYHSVNGKAVVGVARVTREAFADPTAADGDWSAVEIKPEQAVNPPVTLDQIKAEPKLQGIPLLKQARLSVMPLTKEEFHDILKLAK